MNTSDHVAVSIQIQICIKLEMIKFIMIME